MRNIIKYIICVWLICFFHSRFFAQQSKLDTYLMELKSEKRDTNLVIHLYKISDECETVGNYPDGLFFGSWALKLSDSLINESKDERIIKTLLKYKAKSYSNIGLIYYDQGDYTEALKNHFASIKIKEIAGDKKGISISYNNIGLIYTNQGNYPEGLKIYFKALKIMESIGYEEGIASAYDNIGIIYTNQLNYQSALENLFESLKIKLKIGDKHGMISTYNSIGAVYYFQHNFEESLKNFFNALKISEELKDNLSIASCNNNIGDVYFDQAELEKDPALSRIKLEQALSSFLASMKIKLELGSKAGIVSSYINIGGVYAKQLKFKEAEDYMFKAMELSKEIGHKDYLKIIYRSLSDLYSERGNYKAAYENHKLFILYRDSLDNEETRKKTIQSQMTFDFEKKEAVAAAEHKMELENQNMIAGEKSRKQKLVISFVISGLFLVLVFAGFVFRSLRLTRKQKDLIEKQKDIVEHQKAKVEQQKNLVEEHQKEIIDSITYARRIQRSLLPTEKYIEKTLNRLQKK